MNIKKTKKKLKKQEVSLNQVHEDLKIFKRAEHPSFLIINQEIKEGFSLFNIYDFTVTPEGRTFLKQLMAQPLLDYNLIRERQETVDKLYQTLCTNGKTFQSELQKSLKPYTSFVKGFCTKNGAVANLRPFGTLSYKAW